MCRVEIGLKKLYWIGYFSFFLIGAVGVIIGTVLLNLLEHYNYSYTQSGKLIFAQSIGFLIGATLFPFILKKINYRNILLLAALCISLSSLTISFLPHWLVLMSLFLLLGLSCGLIEVAIASIVAGKVKEQKAVVMTRLEVFFGLGALLMPAISGLFIRFDLWNMSFMVLAVFSLILLLLWKFTNFGEAETILTYTNKPNKHQHKANSIDVKGRSGLPKVNWLVAAFILIFFLYVGAEIGIINYLPTYFGEKFELSKSNAAFLVTCFWVSMVIGRLFCGYLAEKLSYKKYVHISILAVIVFMIALSINQVLIFSVILVFLVGLAMSGLFAANLLYANSIINKDAGSTTSILISSGGIGGAVVPLAIGWSIGVFKDVSLVFYIISSLAVTMYVIYLLIDHREKLYNNPRSLNNKASDQY
jgi:FHS family glucose/mannose:H+ symporter-like MFS transporter